MNLFPIEDPHERMASLASELSPQEARQLAYACARPSGTGGYEGKRDPGAIVAQGSLPEEEA